MMNITSSLANEEPPPPGVPPDLHKPYSMLRTINLSVVIIAMVLTTIFVLTRAYVKVVISRQILTEDCMCLKPEAAA